MTERRRGLWVRSRHRSEEGFQTPGLAGQLDSGFAKSLVTAGDLRRRRRAWSSAARRAIGALVGTNDSKPALRRWCRPPLIFLAIAHFFYSGEWHIPATECPQPSVSGRRHKKASSTPPLRFTAWCAFSRVSRTATHTRTRPVHALPAPAFPITSGYIPGPVLPPPVQESDLAAIALLVVRSERGVWSAPTRRRRYYDGCEVDGEREGHVRHERSSSIPPTREARSYWLPSTSRSIDRCTSQSPFELDASSASRGRFVANRSGGAFGGVLGGDDCTDNGVTSVLRFLHPNTAPTRYGRRCLIGMSGTPRMRCTARVRSSWRLSKKACADGACSRSAASMSPMRT